MTILKSCTEIIDYSGISASNIQIFLGYLKAQRIDNFTLRIPAYSDAQDGVLSSTWKTVALNFTEAARAYGITTNMDLHTWHSSATYTMVWDDTDDASDGFDDDNTNHEDNRDTS